MEVLNKMTGRCLLALLFVVLVCRDVCGTYEHIFPKGTADKNILDMLLYRNRYDKRLKPSEGLTTVNASITLLSLSSPDESSLKYEVEFLLHQHWKDRRLKFTSEDDHHYLNAIDHETDIWIPDTYFIKHGDFKDPLVIPNMELRVFSDGSVRLTRRRHLILKCTGNLAIFPFDNPCCRFFIESTSHEKRFLTYNWTDPSLKEADELKTNSLNAYMVNQTTFYCDKDSWRGNFSCLGVELNFTRDKSFYFSTVFIPGMLLVTSSFITFWLEWNAVPGRVMLGVTTMLNFFTMSNNFRSNLPVVSNLTAMNVWDGVCMCFIYASLLEFVTVNYLARKKPRNARLAAAAVTATATATATALSASQSNTATMKREPGLSEVGNNPPSVQVPAPNSHSSAGDTRDNGALNKLVTGREFPPPIRIAKMIDVVSRVVFPIAYGIFLIFFFVRYQ